MVISWLLSIAFSTAIACMAFGAVYRPEALGYLAASPGTLLISCCLPLVLLVRLVEGRAHSATSLNAWWLVAYGILASVLSALFIGLSPLFAAKSLTLLVLSAVWLSPLLFFDHLRVRHLRMGLIAALVICAIGYVFHDLFPGSLPGAIRELAFAPGYLETGDLRTRGFMQENSHFATLVGRYAMMVYLLSEMSRRYSAKRQAVFMLLMMVLLGVVGSKGAAISILAAFLFVSLTRRLIPYLIIFAPVVIAVGLQQAEAVAHDLSNFTSGSTRMTLWLAGLAGQVVDPLGYGYYGFYWAVQNHGGWAMNWLGAQLPLNFSEVAEIVESLSNVSTKSTLFDFMLVYGVFFLWMMVALCRRLNLADPRARAAILYFVLTSLASAGHESISFFLGFTVLLIAFPRLAREHEPAVAGGLNVAVAGRQAGRQMEGT
ncbi:hypothetical protein [Cupriavidus sp. CP313]